MGLACPRHGEIHACTIMPIAAMAPRCGAAAFGIVSGPVRHNNAESRD
jgi:hypothetical protein